MGRVTLSRGFIAALAGIAMTLFAWFGPWAWPAWPAFIVIDFVFGSNSAFGELPFATRAVSVTMLIVANAAFWGALVWLVIGVFRR